MTQQEEIANENNAQAPQEAQVLEKLMEENAQMKDKLLRTMAEMDNLRKRAEREREETSKYAVTGFAGSLVNVAENLFRALESIPTGETNPALVNLRAGVEMTQKELLAAFERHGIKRVYPLGEKFDHNQHQAIAQVDDGATTPGHVAQVVAAGYVIHDRLLKPAMVAVAKAPGGEMPKAVDTSA